MNCITWPWDYKLHVGVRITAAEMDVAKFEIRARQRLSEPAMENDPDTSML
ncbi:MAG: hypothetical protein LUD51_08045 [Clostridia bacterium]|nr:hypothetical protein [Clostridia bacterium]